MVSPLLPQISLSFLLFFWLIALLAMLANTYAKEERPWYGIAFFATILSHIAADFFANHFQPFGTWDTDTEIGFALIYSTPLPPLQRHPRTLLFEGAFYFWKLVILWNTRLKYQE